jgi:septum formation protein
MIDQSMEIALNKVKEFLILNPEEKNHFALGADTLVVVNGKFLGKPKNREEAKEFLSILSNRTHQVITGLALYNKLEIHQDYEITEVRFNKLSNEEIKWYLDQNEWKNVAGAYRIQGKAAAFIESIRGSYSNVVGLPISKIYGMLKANKFPLYKG